jgi:uncharacterized protein YecT (DUF1311 family)
MNRLWNVLLVIFVLTAALGMSALASPNTAQAATGATIEYTAYNVYVKGVKVKFSNSSKFKLVSGAVMVPYTPFLKALGLKTSYDAKTKTITAKSGKTTLKLKVNSKTAVLNNKNKAMAIAPTSIGGSLMVSVQEVGKALGYTMKSRKATYLAKLDAIERGMSDLDRLYEEGSTASMYEASVESYKRWDKALNEIWAQIKKDMPAGAYQTLLQQQRKWIKTRDQRATEAGDVFDGGTFEQVAYKSTQSNETKKRCYELVRGYM